VGGRRPLRPIVFLHGYGGGPAAFDAWRARFAAFGLHEGYAVHYRTQSDDVSLFDLAEGFDRALAEHPRLGSGRPFDAVVHSTGVLVLRAWLAARPLRRARLGRMIALAPATFGSPLAHLGRGMLGALFAGERAVGPDFLEAGDRILAALELGSEDVWRLADQPLPPGLIACGTTGFAFPARLAHPDGSDGVVRVAGCGPDAPETLVDLRREVGGAPRLRARSGTDAAAPVVPVPGRNHATLLSSPPGWLVQLAARVLTHDGPDDGRLRRRIARRAAAARARADRDGAALDRRQWLVRVEDDRAAPVPDYYLDLLTRPAGAHRWRPLRAERPEARFDVHVHRDDPSRRCFHLETGPLSDPGARIALRVRAESGSDRVGYAGYRAPLDVEEPTPVRWTAAIELDADRLHAPTVRLRIRLDRTPLPLDGPTRLVGFPSPGVRSPA
jgi:hypothetical protein